MKTFRHPFHTTLKMAFALVAIRSVISRFHRKTWNEKKALRNLFQVRAHARPNDTKIYAVVMCNAILGNRLKTKTTLRMFFTGALINML